MTTLRELETALANLDPAELRGELERIEASFDVLEQRRQAILGLLRTVEALTATRMEHAVDGVARSIAAGTVRTVNPPRPTVHLGNGRG